MSCEGSGVRGEPEEERAFVAWPVGVAARGGGEDPIGVLFLATRCGSDFTVVVDLALEGEGVAEGLQSLLMSEYLCTRTVVFTCNDDGIVDRVVKHTLLLCCRKWLEEVFDIGVLCHFKYGRRNCSR